jgi:hypothetical protein
MPILILHNSGYLRSIFITNLGKGYLLQKNKLSTDCNYYSLPTRYGEYKYFKDGDKSQKAEKCSYWSRDASLVVNKELE